LSSACCSHGLAPPKPDTPPQVPLERYFPEYVGGNDVQSAVRFVLWRFMQANRARLSVYPQ
jgi:guanine nucleotide-binding protein subunit alpha